MAFALLCLGFLCFAAAFAVSGPLPTVALAVASVVFIWLGDWILVKKGEL